MASNLDLTLRIKADMRNALNSINALNDSLNRVSGSNRSAGNDALLASLGFGRLGDSANRAGDNFDQAGRRSKSLSDHLSSLKNSMLALAGITLGVGMVKGIANAADQYQSLSARVRLVSDSTAQSVTTFKTLFKVANDAGQQASASIELYARMARSLKGSGASTSDLLGVTSTINKAVVVSGATAQEASAAIIQLSQGLSSGTLRGEEFNSVSEQMPRILEMLQKSLGKTRGELRAMANDGKLTTDVVFRAIKEGAADIDREFAQMPKTLANASTEMSNAWLEFVGGTDSALGASRAIAAAISLLASNFSTLATVVMGAVVVFGAKQVSAFFAARAAAAVLKAEMLALVAAELTAAEAAVALATAQLAQVRTANGGIVVQSAQLAATEALTAAQLRLTAATEASNLANAKRIPLLTRFGSGLMALIGGPIGLAIIALVGLGVAFNAVLEHEAEVELQHKQSIQTLQDQTDKTNQLIEAQKNLKAVNPTMGDLIGQGASNTTVLEEQAAKLDELKRKAESVKSMLEFDHSGEGLTTGWQLMELETLERRIKELTPEVEALSNAQRTLSNVAGDQLARAFQAAKDKGSLLKETLDDLNNVQPPDIRGAMLPIIAAAEKELADLNAQVDPLRKKLEKELADATMTAAEQLQLFTDNVIAAAVASGMAPEKIDALRDSMLKLQALQTQTEKAKDDKRKADAAARAGASLAKSNESYVNSLEKQVETLNKSQSQIRAYELAEKKLTGTLLARAKAALAVLEASELQKQSDENNTKSAELQVKYLQAIGKTAEASQLEITTRYQQLTKELEKTGNVEGLEIIKRLLPIEQAKARLDELKGLFDNTFNQQSAQEQSIQAQVQAGLITEIEGRHRLAELHQKTAQSIESNLPALREMASIPGAMGEQAQAMLLQIETQLIALRTTSDELVNALRNGLQNGIASSLEGLAMGTMNLRDAITNLVQEVTKAMASLASQELAKMAMGGLSSMAGSVSGMFGGGAEVAAKTAADTSGSTMYATAITTSSAAGAATLGTTLTASFTAGAAQIAAAMQAGAVSSGVGAGAMAAFASGGHITGRGTGTSDDIPIWASNGEFMIRERTVRQFGVNFFHNLNAGRMPKFANGGLISAPTISNPPAFSAPVSGGLQAAQSASPVSIQQTLVLDAGDAFSAGLSTLKGKREMMTYIRANKNTLKQELDI